VPATASRQAALRLLEDVERGGTTLADLLAAEDDLSTRDHAFLQELVLGTLRRRGFLDHALSRLLDRPLESLDPSVLNVLRLGAYQMLHLNVPDRAAVSESVELVRVSSPRAAGFVNAVLRRLAREGPPAVPDPEEDPLGWLTTAGSLPPWLAKRWLSRLGPSVALRRARILLEPPPKVFRLNPRIGDARDLTEACEALPLQVPGAFRARSGRPADLAAKGILHLQDEGSQLVAHLVPPRGRILDACAAPGGKSTLIGDRLESGSLIAGESSLPRLARMARLLERWGSTNVRLVGADASRPPFRSGFTSILLDAPCSGLGTLGRHPDIKWRVKPSELARQAERQRGFLEHLAPLVLPGGTLVYATCSSEPEENEDVVSGFLLAHPEFAPAALPAWAEPFKEGPFARTRPELHGGDAFFAARLRRD
jgi:16S rRNA (cytosine967-C5)-methyltransferase